MTKKISPKYLVPLLILEQKQYHLINNKLYERKNQGSTKDVKLFDNFFSKQFATLEAIKEIYTSTKIKSN